ncbi:MAG TPA: dimethylmenaquinone methyltransferase, partial [Planctomycetaceae bacterium]|nr:dimethylmenaquinone methyltransferase [Planctomycetaceae bacterium]
LPRIGQSIAKNSHSAYDYLPSSVIEFPSGSALAQRMAANGLVRVEMFPYTMGVATLYLAEKPR